MAVDLVCSLSMLISVPGNLFYGRLYLTNTEIETTAWSYLYLLTAINFLYPLGAVLTCFFLGLRKRRLVFYGSIGCHLLKLSLVYLLIFGWRDWIPAFGLFGGALAALVAQGGYCLLLLVAFLNKDHASTYDTRRWLLRPKALYDSIRPGLLREVGYVVTFTAWLTTIHLMTAKGGNYLLVLSLGVP